MGRVAILWLCSHGSEQRQGDSYVCITLWISERGVFSLAFDLILRQKSNLTN
jgi:hypothetical protein